MREDFTTLRLLDSVIKDGIRFVDPLPFVISITRHNHRSELCKTAVVKEPGSKKHSNQRLMETVKMPNVAVALLLWWPNPLDAVKVKVNVNIHLFLF